MVVDPLIELRDVTKYYGKGEVFVGIGPSGAGESTGRQQRVAIARARHFLSTILKR